MLQMRKNAGTKHTFPIRIKLQGNLNMTKFQ